MSKHRGRNHSLIAIRFLNIRLDGITVEDPERHPHMVSRPDLDACAVLIYAAGNQKLLHTRVRRAVCPDAISECRHDIIGGRNKKRPVWVFRLCAALTWLQKQKKLVRRTVQGRYGSFRVAAGAHGEHFRIDSQPHHVYTHMLCTISCSETSMYCPFKACLLTESAHS